MTAYTDERLYSTKRTDSNGWVWQFAYWGARFVYIRDIPNELSDPMPPIGEDASRDDWPYLIDLNCYGMRPDDVTSEWLGKRATDWIDGRNEDIEKGNV